MSYFINELSPIATVVIKNTYTSGAVAPSDLALDLLDRTKDTVWNTGLNSVSSGSATVKAEGNFARKDHGIMIRKYGSNACIIVNPGQEVTIDTRLEKETLYYLGIKSPFLEITSKDYEGSTADPADEHATANAEDEEVPVNEPENTEPAESSDNGEDEGNVEPESGETETTDPESDPEADPESAE